MRYLSLILVLPLMACLSEEQKPKSTLANPASVHCAEKGGTVKIVSEAAGQVGYCHLPDGTVMEEWALFKRDTKDQ
ncbi:MAG: DUF333 domain-containing protein [Sneathiella sp.]|uniref:putative hemolysin n=1 Tax=Sneathiella sp. TaxID=1964365 RepID=UPI003001FF49